MGKSIWFNVLDFWCNKRVPIGSGLTIPFLIGSDFLINGELKSVSVFLNELQSLDNEIFSIRNCNVIGEYVIQLNDSSDYSLNYFPKTKNLVITDENLIELYKSDKMIDFLTEKYSECLEKNLFSINYGKWEKINKTDLVMIKNCVEHRI